MVFRFIKWDKFFLKSDGPKISLPNFLNSFTISVNLLICGPCITEDPNFSGSIGFWPPKGTSDLPIKVILDKLKKRPSSPIVSARYISVSELIELPRDLLEILKPVS